MFHRRKQKLSEQLTRGLFGYGADDDDEKKKIYTHQHQESPYDFSYIFGSVYLHSASKWISQ